MASTEDDLVPVEREALRQLLQSDGWKHFEQMVDKEWGADATLRKIDAALKNVNRGDNEAVNDTVQQIQASRREVYKLLRLPAARLGQLTPVAGLLGRFAGQRRTSR